MANSPRLEAEEIPTLAFGALTAWDHAACLVISLADGQAKACRRWLSRMASLLSYGQTARGRPAYVLALAASGLRALGLDPDDLATFPAAFVNGMVAPPRSRALGDVEEHAPKNWEWGGGRAQADAVVLVYASSAAELDRAIAAIDSAGPASIGAPIWLAVGRRSGNMCEPFGFRDGISQPVIPGTPPARSAVPTDQLVAAGEFILGYPDSRNFMPPVPTVAAARARGGVLPRLPDGRGDLGRNSSFFVVRQLRQNVVAFQDWVGAMLETG